MRRRLVRMAGLLSLALLSTCSDRSSSVLPTSPSQNADSAGPASTITLRLIHSARGDTGISETRTVQPGRSTAVVLADLAVDAIDRRRAIAVELSAHGELGSVVAQTRTGTLNISNPGRDATLGIMLMSTINGVDYDCLDYCPACSGTRPHRSATMRMAEDGEEIHGFRARAASDLPFRYAAGLLNAALDVSGIRLGRIEFKDGSPVDLLGVWAELPAAVSGYGYKDAAMVHYRFGDPANTSCFRPCAPDIAPYEQNLRYAAAVALHELGHSFLSAPDYDTRPGCASNGSSSLTCMLIDCALADGSYPHLSATGADAVRYWALMNHRP